MAKAEEDNSYYDKTAEGLEHLATATMSDKYAMENLAQGISTSNSTAKALLKLQEQITELALQVQSMSYNNNSDQQNKQNQRNSPKILSKRE